MIVLHELHANSRLFQGFLVIGFGKKPPLIGVPRRFDNLHFRYCGGKNFHYSSAVSEIAREAVAASACCDAAAGASILFAPPWATRLLARNRDSNVPASVHQLSSTL